MIDLDAWWQEAHRVAKPRAAIVCTGSQPFTSRLIMSNIERFRYEWIWRKSLPTRHLNAKSMPLLQHENILVFEGDTYYPQLRKRGNTRKRGMYGVSQISSCYGKTSGNIKEGIPIDLGYPISVLDFNTAYHDREAGLHPTQKPVALFEYLIRTYTQPGDLVVDPFVGSGTTAIAARNTGRRFICGDNGTDEKTGKTWAEIARTRLAEPYTISMFDAPPAQVVTPTQRGLFEE